MAVLALVRGLHLAAERVHHELQSIADAQHRQPHAEDARVHGGRVFVIDRRRPTGQDDADRRVAANFIQAGGTGQDNGKDVLFADAARNQLRILRSEVEDNNRLGFH